MPAPLFDLAKEIIPELPNLKAMGFEVRDLMMLALSSDVFRAKNLRIPQLAKVIEFEKAAMDTGREMTIRARQQRWECRRRMAATQPRSKPTRRIP